MHTNKYFVNINIIGKSLHDIIYMMQKQFNSLFFFIICIAPLVATTQDSIIKSDSLQINRNTVFHAAAYTSIYYTSSLYILSKTWYKDTKTVPFHFYNDNRGYLQVDKLGHAFGAYIYSYLGYHFMLHSGSTRKEALYLGATLGAILQTPIEIMDALHEGYGFSWGDIAANTMGSMLVFGQELLFNEQVLKYKFSYWQSGYSDKANGYLGKTTFERLFEDYNGHTYWITLPINRLININKIPPWLNIAFGYGANGMYGEFENISNYNGADIPKTIRYRQYIVSLDIDWTKIKTNSRILNLLIKGMTFIKLPFPSIEYNSRGKFVNYWVYY